MLNLFLIYLHIYIHVTAYQQLLLDVVVYKEEVHQREIGKRRVGGGLYSVNNAN